MTPTTLITVTLDHVLVKMQGHAELKPGLFKPVQEAVYIQIKKGKL